MKPTIRCSNLDQLFECSGSFTLQRLVKARDGEESREGTALHWNIAARLASELGAAVPESGLPKPDLPECYKPSSFSAWIGDYCFEACRTEAKPDWSLEVEVPMAYEFERFILSGHIDALLVSGDGKRSSAFDWKTGYRAVDAADSNNQALGYIVLQKRAYPQLEESWFTIVQPRANEDDGEQRVSATCVKGEALDDSVAYLERRVNAALDSLDEINSGPRQCRWCSAALQCPAAIAEREAMKMKLTPEMLARLKREPDDATLGDWIVSARVIDQPIKDAKEILHERLGKTGRITAGCGVSISQSEQAGTYKVTNPGPLYANIVAALPPHEVAKVVDPSVTRLKDAIARVLNIPKTGKAPMTAESVFAAKFAPHLEQGTRRIFKFS